jgi:hypothetical protein
MLGDNAVVDIWRKGAYDPDTGTTPGYSLSTAHVSCYIYDPSKSVEARGFSVSYELVMSCDWNVSIQGQDQIVGWNPLSLAPAPVFVVDHVAASPGGIGSHKTAYLNAFRG